MKVTPELRRKIEKAVETSIRIEGYVSKLSPEQQARIAEWMKRVGIKVSPRSK
jgi:hypothetical protein